MVKGIIFSLFLVVAILLNGCSAGNVGPTVESMDDYVQGKFTPGWFYGMTPSAMKEYADGILDTRAREMALNYYAKYYASLDPNTPVTNIGKIIVENETNETVVVGVEGPVNMEWVLGPKQRLEDNLMPGEYATWHNDGSGKKYTRYKDGPRKGELDPMTVGLSLVNYKGVMCNAKLLFTR